MKRYQNLFIALLAVLSISIISLETAAPSLSVQDEGLTAARGPETVSGDIYTGYWHNDRSGVYIMTFYDSSALKTTYHIRWFASVDSAMAYLDLDWAGRDTVTYREYPLELEAATIE